MKWKGIWYGMGIGMENEWNWSVIGKEFETELELEWNRNKVGIVWNEIEMECGGVGNFNKMRFGLLEKHCDPFLLNSLENVVSWVSLLYYELYSHITLLPNWVGNLKFLCSFSMRPRCAFWGFRLFTPFFTPHTPITGLNPFKAPKM